MAETYGPDSQAEYSLRFEQPPMGMFTGPDEGDPGPIVVVDASGDVIEREFNDYAAGEAPDLEHCFGDAIMVLDEDGSPLELPPGTADGSVPEVKPIHDQQLARFMRQTYGHVEP